MNDEIQVPISYRALWEKARSATVYHQWYLDWMGDVEGRVEGRPRQRPTSVKERKTAKKKMKPVPLSELLSGLERSGAERIQKFINR